MQSSGAGPKKNNSFIKHGLGRLAAIVIATGAISPAIRALGDDVSTNAPMAPSDPVLGLMLEKGMITEEEAAKVQAQVDSLRTNPVAQIPPSKWNISSGIKDIGLYGDLRLRYEEREATDPKGGSINLDRLRYAVRLGLRGDLFDDFDYGFRMDTSANPRSSWASLGSSTSGLPYQGPFGKSNGGLNVSQVYLGWDPASWFNLTLGKMPNPLYTTPMVWSPTLNPEGAAEQFKYTVGDADLLATFGQFFYQDTNPTQSSQGYFNSLDVNTSGGLPFLLAWQGGLKYHLTKQVDFKVEPALYYYTSLNNGKSPALNNDNSPGFSGVYVGQGSPQGINGIPAYYNLAPVGSTGFDGFASDQTGINDLMVLEIPFELNVKLKHVDLQLFGDYAQNLEGSKRAEAAYLASNSSYFSEAGAGYLITPIHSPQSHDDRAYQVGLAIASPDSLGLVYGATDRKHSWEFRTYWQHVEQYALDPNLIDTDFFEGVENMQGIYAAAAYGLTDNLIGTVRYGYASRINNKLGTGGSGQDIPQMNPIGQYSLFQVDLTLKF